MNPTGPDSELELSIQSRKANTRGSNGLRNPIYPEVTRRGFVKQGTMALAAISVFPSLAKQASAADLEIDQNEMPTADASQSMSNSAFRLQLSFEAGILKANLSGQKLGQSIADAPYLYRAVANDEVYDRLTGGTIQLVGERLVVRGRLAGLDLEHEFFLPKIGKWMEERIVLSNPSASIMALSELETGFQRRVTDEKHEILADLKNDRWVALPFRSRADDPQGYVNDFSIHELMTQPGYEPWMDCHQKCTRAPSKHRRSEGWAWVHGEVALGIFVFNQQNMLFSVVSAENKADGGILRFGGACMISGEPDALTRIGPCQSVDLGLVRYQLVSGGYVEANYALRDMLDGHGCRFPRDYNPPVHWEQLYDMPNAWDDRLHRYARSIVEKEAVKAVAYHCEALYLDPGWDTSFGSYIWGEEWLGPRCDFIKEMRSKYGLGVSLHCPLATWLSQPSTMGPSSVSSWPEAARLQPPGGVTKDNPLRVPAVRDGRRNLALLPAAKANASSIYDHGWVPIHQVAHLNNGWYGNSSCWIGDQMPAWAEIDLGDVYQISEVCLSNDHVGQFSDRAATKLRILVATVYQANSGESDWQSVANYDGSGLLKEQKFTFPSVAARWVRVELLESLTDQPRIDEIEIYQSKSVSPEAATAFAQSARRGPEPIYNNGQPLICQGSKQYLAEAGKRLRASCADGVGFLMYDGNWWNGGCSDPNHGHPVPYTMEDHVHANLDLVRRVHEEFPKVLIELHDPITGGSQVRFAPVYYKYGLPGSYDENWGFELMWKSIDDLKEGRALSLYYYNLGCNVPIYLHVNLNGDSEHCVMLWWYASTCRHLGIGGTSPNQQIVKAQQEAMAWYSKRAAFFKRGEFFGITPDIHLHVLSEQKAFVVNLFNLSNITRMIEGKIRLDTMGLDPLASYVGSSHWGSVEDGVFTVSLNLPPMSAQVAEFNV